jgi:hypothetical protein
MGQDCDGVKTAERENTSTNAAIPLPSPACFQIEPTQQSVELGTVEFDARLAFGRHGQLKNADLKPLVPNAKAIDVPK